MAMGTRTVISKLSLAASLSRSFSSSSSRSLAFSLPCSSPLIRFRPLLAAAAGNQFRSLLSTPVSCLRCFSTRPTTSSLNDSSPNWSNRPPKETILLDGCDFEHWLVVMEPSDPNLTRDEIIDSYIKTLAQVLGSEEEARMSIYSVSTKHYFAFGAKVSEEISYKIKPLPKVRWVLPDSYLDVKNKDYGGEPFIDGKAVPYDPKYHEEWVRNNARAQERSRRNDRPRNFDRSRNFERRRENMQNFQNRDAPPMANQEFHNRDAPSPQNAAPPRDMPPMPSRDAAPPNMGVPNYPNQRPNPQGNYSPSAGPGYQGNAQGYQGGNPTGGIGGGPGYPGGNPAGGIGGGPGYQGGNPAGGIGGGPGYQGAPQSYQGNVQSHQGGNPGYQGGAQGYQGGGQGYPGGGPSGPGYQGGGQAYQGGYQGNGAGYQGGNSAYQGGNSGYQGGSYGSLGGGSTQQEGGQQVGSYPGRDMPGRD